MGPFRPHEAQNVEHGELVHRDADGDPLLVMGTVKDTLGRPVTDVKIDIWETDSTGYYDVRCSERDGPNGRAVLRTDNMGGFWLKAIVLVPYPILHDGPAGKRLKILHRHPYKPSHVHFMFEKPGYDHLIMYARSW